MSKFDVLAVGNAIVDIIARCDDSFLSENDIIKGAMNLIDAERAELLYSKMGPAVEASGGSAGNTAAGIAGLGGKAAYFGKVAEDQLGTIFQHDIRAQGVAFDTVPLAGEPATARSARSMIATRRDRKLSRRRSPICPLHPAGSLSRPNPAFRSWKKIVFG